MIYVACSQIREHSCMAARVKMEIDKMPYEKAMIDQAYDTVKEHRAIYNAVIATAPIHVQADLTFKSIHGRMKWHRGKRYSAAITTAEEVIAMLESNALEGVSYRYLGSVTSERFNKTGMLKNYKVC